MENNISDDSIITTIITGVDNLKVAHPYLFVKISCVSNYKNAVTSVVLEHQSLCSSFQQYPAHGQCQQHQQQLLGQILKRLKLK